MILVFLVRVQSVWNEAGRESQVPGTAEARGEIRSLVDHVSSLGGIQLQATGNVLFSVESPGTGVVVELGLVLLMGLVQSRATGFILKITSESISQ